MHEGRHRGAGRRFEHRSAVITGAASGIGLALARQLAREGARLFLADLNRDRLEEAAGELKAAGFPVESMTVDVADRPSVIRLVQGAVAAFSRLDYMFNNAGICVGGEAKDFLEEDWRKVIETNLFGVVNGVAAAYPVMVEQGFGHIVNTASIAGLFPLPGQISYVTSKHAVVGLSHALRSEAAEKGVRVTVVCPGLVETPIYETTRIIGYDRRRLFDKLPRGISAEECASSVLRGVLRNRSTIVLPPHARLMWLVNRVNPDLAIAAARLILRTMRSAAA